MQGSRFRQPMAPVKVGDELEVTIEAVGEKGDGLAKKEGFVLFVPNTQAGETVKVRITKVLRKVGFAEVVGKADAPASEDAPAENDEPEAEEASEDSEDFGEDASEEDDSAEESEDVSEEEKKEE